MMTTTPDPAAIQAIVGALARAATSQPALIQPLAVHTMRIKRILTELEEPGSTPGRTSTLLADLFMQAACALTQCLAERSRVEERGN
jgi:hypothetical protein